LEDQGVGPPANLLSLSSARTELTTAGDLPSGTLQRA